MKLAEYLNRALAECERQIRSLDLQQKADIRYVNAPDALQTEVDYYRCQIELQAVEQEYLQKRLVILRKWAAAPVQLDVLRLVPPGEAP